MLKDSWNKLLPTTLPRSPCTLDQTLIPLGKNNQICYWNGKLDWLSCTRNKKAKNKKAKVLKANSLKAKTLKAKNKLAKNKKAKNKLAKNLKASNKKAKN